MSRFGNLTDKQEAPAAERAPANVAQQEMRSSQQKAISGYFSPAMSVAMRTTALHKGITLQKAMAEAFNLWLVQNGQSPIGE
ncbi:MAG TPA: ribbon-helix-helix domain-containing protein [Pseudolabrys sp.]|nr:ribbon-helix-helix domain-containing protein [Pseudolabrys sp.]